MSEDQKQVLKAALRKQRMKVQSSEIEARKLLNGLNMLTPTGKLKKAFQASTSVPR